MTDRLAVESLSVRFGGLVAVRDLSLRVAPGEIRGLIGPNGAGKTTVINAITGVVPIEAGRRAPRWRSRVRIAGACDQSPGHRANVPARRAVRRAVGARQRIARRGPSRACRLRRGGARHAARAATRERGDREALDVLERFELLAVSRRAGGRIALRRAEAHGPRARARGAPHAAAAGRTDLRHERVRSRSRDRGGARARRIGRASRCWSSSTTCAS